MELKDVQRSRPHERRTYRINIRITESQNTFIRKNNLSITKILNEALKQLGYVQPILEELNKKDHKLMHLDEKPKRTYYKHNKTRRKHY